MPANSSVCNKGKLHEVIEAQIHIAREMVEDDSNVPSAVVCLTTLFHSLQESKFPAEVAKRIAREQKELPGIIFHRGFSSEVEVIQEAITDLANRSTGEEFVEMDYDELVPLDEFEFVSQFDTKGRWMRVRHRERNNPCLSVGLKGAEALGGQNFEGRLLSQIFVQGKVRKFIKHM